MHAADRIDADGTAKCSVGGKPSDGATAVGQHLRKSQVIIMTGIELATTRHAQQFATELHIVCAH